METDHLIPDSPFRGGVTGKYKLLIKSVTRKAFNYEYELVDAEGKEYKAGSPKHYAEGGLLRCMVYFKVTNARLVVSDILICKKQDLTTTIPEPTKLRSKPRSQPSPHPTPQSVSKAGESSFIPTQYAFREGDPSAIGVTGSYRLTVQSSSRWYNGDQTKYVYVLKDGRGQSYHSISGQKYELGDKLVCRVEVIHETKRNVYFVAISDDDTSKPMSMVDGELTHRHHYLVSPVPTRIPNRQPKPKKKSASSKIKTVYLNKYVRGDRYNFEVTSKHDSAGDQIVKDEAGRLHLLTETGSRYSEGDKVRCTVKGFVNYPKDPFWEPFLILSAPRIIQTVTVTVPYIKTPERWHGEVQDLGKHKCGKAFKCSCCGRDFPAFAGWRVDLKEIYFCNACAKKIYEPKGRGNRHFIIPTPMGNKR
jgi:hypothetical protein